VIDLQLHPGGVVLPVRAQPGARSAAIRGEQTGALKVAVTPVAEKGKANKAVIALLTNALGLRRSQVELVAGLTSPEKRLLIRDVTLAQLQQKLQRVLDHP
jgi:uncharacterized protein